MQMVPLHRILHQPKPELFARGGERTAQMPENARAAEALRLRADAQGHMYRMMPAQLRTRAMRYASMRQLRSARAETRATAFFTKFSLGVEEQRQLLPSPSLP